MPSSRITGLNENIRTFGATGLGRDYTPSTWLTFETDTDVDLVGTTTTEVLECYDDGVHEISTAITFLGATTSADYRRIIRPASGERHDGTQNSGVRFSITNPADTNGISISENYFSFQDIVVTFTLNSASARSAIALNNAFSSCIGVIVHDCANSGTGTARGIQGVISSCIACNCISSRNELQGFFGTGHFLNCTSVFNTNRGFQQGTAAMVVKNCIASGNGSDDYQNPDATSSHCSSEDGTAPTTNARTGTPTFINSGSDDFHLSTSDTVSLGFGTDLSTYTGFGSIRSGGANGFDDDIDGETITTWSIGVDSHIAASGSSAAVYYYGLMG